MDICIVDPVTGRHAEVDKDNRVLCNTSSAPRIAWETHNGKSFIFYTPKITVTTNQGLMLWIRNESLEEHFVLNRITMGWNGGSTNHIRAVAIETFVATPEPNTGIVLTNGMCLDTSRSITGRFTVKYWDGVTGNGMSGGANNGVFMGGRYCKQGRETVDFSNSLHIGPGGILGITAQGDEIGNLYLTMTGFTELLIGG